MLVKEPVAGVVAPTVPLMLMEAVPVRFVTVPLDGVPNAGVTSVGLLANTKAPVPVSSVTAAAKFAEEGVAKNVATPVPRPDTPVLMGRPVALVSVAEDGVPRAGVTKVGLVANTKAPVPVSPVTAAARLALEGVPKKVATPVPNDVIPVPPLATGSVPVTPVVKGRPVAFVNVALEGVPSAGVTRVGELANTKAPLPVSSEITPANSLDVVAASADNLSVVTTRVLDAGIVVPLRVLVLLDDNVVNAPAAGVVPPTAVLSIVPALMSAVSATRLSMLAVPSMYRSLNSRELVPRSMSLSVTGTIAPSWKRTCSVDVPPTSTNTP